MANLPEKSTVLDKTGIRVNYGAVHRQRNFSSFSSSTTGSPSRKVIYCVHGKPNDGCCKVLEGEIIDIISDEDNMSAVTKENVVTTELVNKHCHRSSSPDIDKKARKKLITASILCVFFMIGEIIGGYLSNSLAIASDAAHLLTDFASFMISLFSLYMASRPCSKKMLFGWYRAEVIGAITSVLMIWVVTGVLVFMAVQRIVNHTYEIDAEIMLITSGLGVFVNLVMGFTLHQHGHSHNGSDTHTDIPNHTTDHNIKTGHSQNINVRAAFIHVIGDFIQSFGVFVAALVIYFKSDWVLIDPICTFIFSLLVLFTTFAIMKDAVMVLMEALPKGIDFEDVMNILLKIDGVKRVHNLRIWALSLDKIAMSAHIAIDPGTNPQSILMVATKDIHDKYNFFEITLQIEEFQDIMEDCIQCRNP